jgi:hypothetical protein
MAKIPVGYSELIKAFREHSREMENCWGASKYLLYFYAVECGLKHLLIKRNHCRRTDELGEDHGHDLRGILKALRVPRSMLGEAPDHFRLQRDNQECYDIRESHQAWRYGVDIREQDEVPILRYFDKITEWIRGKV